MKNVKSFTLENDHGKSLSRFLNEFANALLNVLFGRVLKFLIEKVSRVCGSSGTGVASISMARSKFGPSLSEYKLLWLLNSSCKKRHKSTTVADTSAIIEEGETIV